MSRMSQSRPGLRYLRSTVDAGFGGKSANLLLGIDFLCLVVNVEDSFPLLLLTHAFRSGHFDVSLVGAV